MQSVKLSLVPPIFCCLKIVFYFLRHFQVFLQYSQCFSNTKNISNHVEDVRNVQKLNWRKYLIKYYIIQKGFCLKITNFSFVVSYLKISWHCCQKEKFIISLLAFVIMFQLVLKKIKWWQSD